MFSIRSRRIAEKGREIQRDFPALIFMDTDAARSQGIYFAWVGSISVGLGTGCSLCSTMVRINSTVPPKPK